MRIVAALPVVLALLHTPPGGAVFPSGLPAAAQSAAEAETSLELDRPSRRLIQQGLRNEGSTRVRRTGCSGRAREGPSGRRRAGKPRPAISMARRQSCCAPQQPGPPSRLLRKTEPNRRRNHQCHRVSPPSGVATAGPAPSPERCDEWNTEAYFETATVEEVTACLAAGADVAALTERDAEHRCTWQRCSA